MADLPPDETIEVVLVDGAGINEGSIDASGRVYVGNEPRFLLDCEKKRLYSQILTINMATATENRIILFRNPSGSGKVIYLQRLQVLLTNTNNSSGVIRGYVAPTVTTNGTPLTPVNTNVGGGGASSIADVFSTPVVSAVGTLAFATRVQGGDGAQPTDFDFDGSTAINPGVDVLITGTPDGNNRELIITIMWLEK